MKTGRPPGDTSLAQLALWAAIGGLLLFGVESIGLGGVRCAAAAEPADNQGATPKRLILVSAQPAAEMNALFERTSGWIGGDGAYSVRLAPRRTLWLFSDTWVGDVRDGKRTGATIVNNTAAIQEGRGPQAKMRFFIRRDQEGRPHALIKPVDGRGWYWLQAGIYVHDRLLLFLSRMEKTPDPGVFGFRLVDQSLGIVSNPHDEPTAWRVEQRKLPFTIVEPRRELTFGAAVLQEGNDVYLYGVDEDVAPGGREKHLILARAPAAEIDNFAAWRFFRQATWQDDCRLADRMLGGMANDCSVTFVPQLKHYVLVYTERGLSARILARSALRPWGPWSAPIVVYQCPEMAADKKIFCYNAKAHFWPGDEGLTASYVANSLDFWQVAGDARLYWPRFVCLRLGVEP